MGSDYQGAEHNQTKQSKIRQNQHTNAPHRTPLTKQVEDLPLINQIKTAYMRKKREQEVKKFKAICKEDTSHQLFQLRGHITLQK